MVGIINTTSECNMACKYCFAGNCESQTANIPKINSDFENAIPKFKVFIDKIVAYNNGAETQIIFHGGEPFLINVELLSSICEYTQRKGYSINYVIQTNGTIINDVHIHFLKRYNVKIGISLDGVKESHDAYRVFKNGKGTYDVIFNNIIKLKNSGIECGCLITFTDRNINYIENIYNFFDKHNIHFSFNPYFVPEYFVEVKPLDMDIYAKRICDLFDIWVNDQNSDLAISPFDRIISYIINPEKPMLGCHWSQDCSKSFIAIDANGLLYPCNHFCGNRSYSYGDIESFDIMSIREEGMFSDRWRNLKNTLCNECEISNMCYGGCPAHSFCAYGDVYHKDFVCKGYKKIVKHIYDTLKKYECE